MNTKTKRQQKREQDRRQKQNSRLIWIGIGMAALLILAFAFSRRSVAPGASGEVVPVMASSAHIPTDTDPGTYNTDPPTSGPHYAEEADAGFYDENIY